MFRSRKTEAGHGEHTGWPSSVVPALRYIAFALTMAVATAVFAENNPSVNYFEDPPNYPGAWPADNSWVPYTSGGDNIYLRMCLDTNPYSKTAKPFVNIT